MGACAERAYVSEWCATTGKVGSRRTAIEQEEEPMKGYCMRCRAEREIAEAHEVRMKNGRPATEGKCPVCSTKMYRLGRPK